MQLFEQPFLTLLYCVTVCPLMIDSANDNNPQITPTSVDVARYLYDREGETDVLTFNITDADADADGEIARVSIIANPDGAPFRLDFDGSAATLTVTGSLNSVSSPVTLKIAAIDNGSSPRTETILFKVHIHNPPTIDAPENGATLYFDEDLGPGDVIQTGMTGTSPGTTPPTIILSSQSPGNYFIFTSGIEIKSGVASETFDVEAADPVTQFQVTTRVTETVHNLYYVELNLTLIVVDVNDNAPQITYSSSEENILESLAAGSTIMEFNTTDADRDAPNNQINVSLSGTNNDHFTIDGNILKLATPSQINYDNVPVYNLQIVAIDQADDPDKLTSSVDITITVDTVPEIDPTHMANITEDSLSPAQVIELAATDRDGTGLTYNITGGNDDGYFVVDGAFIKVAAGIPETALDIDGQAGDKTFTLDVMVSDGTFNDTTVLTIYVDDVNDNSPIFDNVSYSFDVYEQSAPGTVVVSAVATDDDRSFPNNQLTYTLSGTNADDFEITEVGELRIAAGKVLNYTEVASYSLTITASDGGVPTRTASVTATGSVVTDTIPFRRRTSFSDVPKVSGQATRGRCLHSPEFSSDTYEIDMDEHKPADTSVFTMTAKDRDGQTLTYTLDDASGHFNMEGSLVKTSDNIDDTTFDVDVESKTYEITLIVDDGTYNDTAVLTINVVDVNDNPPVFAEDSYRHGVHEDTPEGTLVLSVVASDADKKAPNNQVTYAFSGTDHEHFDIDQTTGEIKLATVLDYTTKQEYDVTVTATDGGVPVLSSSVLVTFQVETTPKLERPDTSEDPISILEDLNPGELVYTCVTLDKDTPDEELTYSIVDTSSTPLPFVLIGDELKTKSDLAVSDINVDGDTAVMSYNITIMVHDGKYNDTGIVTINIGDVNDEIPSFTEASYTVDIMENATGVITFVEAVDKDYSPPNNEVTFSISDGNDEGFFAIHNETGSISVVKELKKVGYKIEVAATDGGSPANEAKVIVVVNVDGNTIDECASGPCANGATCRPNVNYFWCDCAVGWDGALCTINIDDCSPNPCENGGSCEDQVAGYTCDCEPGWGDVNCTTACMGHTYGRNCAQPCSCNNSNIADTAQAQAQRCEIKAGACICNSHWQGRTCDENADECIQDSTLCPAVNNACEDTIGSYECVCKTGFTTDANFDCIIDTSDNNPKNLPSNAVDNARAKGKAPVMIAVVLDIPECTYNLDKPSEYKSIKDSLVVQNDATSEAAVDLSNELKTLKDNGTMTVLDQPASIRSMSVNGNDVSEINRLCVIYESLTSCGDSYTCQVNDGTPYCREVKDNHTVVIIGVGIGGGVTAIFLIGFAIVIMALVVKRRRESSRSKYGSRHRSKSNSHKRDYYHSDNGHGKQYDYGPRPSRKYDYSLSYLSRSNQGSPMYEAYSIPSRYSAKYY